MDATRVGKVTEHILPTGKGTHRFTVGGKKVAVWPTLKRDGMEIQNPALEFLSAAAQAQSLAFVQGYEKDEEYNGRAFKRFYATDAYDPPEGVSVASENGFKGREPGAFDRTTMARWAISAAIEAKASQVEVDDDLLGLAAQLFQAQLELSKEQP